jgi:mono/diheme cytochrome c family protein
MSRAFPAGPFVSTSLLGAWGLVFLFLVSRGLAGGEEKAPGRGRGAEPPSFYRDIQPLFQTRCVGCHGGDSPKAKLRLSSLEELRAGGKHGDPIVPSKPEESLLFLLLSGERKPKMPPEKEGALEPEEIALVRAWIQAGCPAGEQPREPLPYSRPLEPPVYSRPPAVKALAYTGDGRLLLAAGYREVLVLRAEGEGLLPVARLLGEAEEIGLLGLSPDGAKVLAAGGSPGRFGEVQLWDLAERRLLWFQRIGRDCLFAGAFSAAGDRLVAAGTDRALHVLESATGKELYSTEIHSDWVFGAAFNPEGTRIVSAGRDKTVKVSACPGGEFLQTLATLEGPVMRVVARPGTAQFLAGGESRKPVLYDAKEMKQVKELETQPGAILALAASADGKLLAVAGSADEVRVYEAESGKRKAAFKVPGGWVYALAIRPDSLTLAAAGYDGQIRLFDLKEGKDLRAFSAAPIGRLREF